MGTFNLNFNFNFISFYLLLLALFTFYPTTIISTQLSSSNSIGDIECEFINCGEGVCKASNQTALGFDCECNPGWKKIQVGLLTLPTCVPNCTINFQCDESPSPPAPPAPPIPPQGCALVWCGDGTCVTNGTGYACQCPQGSWNLLDMPGFACFKPCYFGGDCKIVRLVVLLFPVLKEVSITIILLISIILTWI
ncbi:hypothetical protein ACE6H2_010193 [Prunus campanulata]